MGLSFHGNQEGSSTVIRFFIIFFPSSFFGGRAVSYFETSGRAPVQAFGGREAAAGCSSMAESWVATLRVLSFHKWGQRGCNSTQKTRNRFWGLLQTEKYGTGKKEAVYQAMWAQVPGELKGPLDSELQNVPMRKPQRAYLLVQTISPRRRFFCAGIPYFWFGLSILLLWPSLLELWAHCPLLAPCFCAPVAFGGPFWLLDCPA